MAKSRRSQKSRQRKKRLRRTKNKQTKADLLKRGEGGSACARRAFSGWVRRGDAALIEFQFSGIRVPYDPDNPGEGLIERTELICVLASETEADV